mmetsp:Transcript_9597/g.14459  ORF Transcript_9597/g.14459 Transcript_9597/m.14459 type:complete len:88 (-) Transcript_9597:11-274(-)
MVTHHLVLQRVIKAHPQTLMHRDHSEQVVATVEHAEETAPTKTKTITIVRKAASFPNFYLYRAVKLLTNTLTGISIMYTIAEQHYNI